MARPSATAIPQLGEIPAISQSALAPGGILLDRFCVVGSVRHRGASWTAPVTDLERSLGQGPNHRVDLHHLPSSPERDRTLRRALAIPTSVGPRVHGLYAVHEGPQPGLLVVADPIPACPPPSAPRDQRVAALALTELLAQLHEAGIEGVRFTRADIRVQGSRVHLDGFGHLLATGGAHDDLADLLALFGEPVLGELATSAPQSARALWDALRRTARETAVHPGDILPAVAPFVGRTDLLRRILDELGGVGAGRPALITLAGPRGVGKSRFVDQLALEIERTHAAVVVRVTLSRDSREDAHRLAGLFDDLVAALRRMPHDLRADVRRRIVDATAPLTAIAADASLGLAALLGDVPPPPDIVFEERMVRHAAVLANTLAAVGTSRVPLVLLVDNAELADRTTRAILRDLCDPLRQHHSLVVLACRDAVPPELGEHARAHVDLPAFTPIEVRRLVEQSLPGPLRNAGATANALCDASGGLPLAAWTTLQAWIDEGVVRASGGSGWGIATSLPTARGVVDLLRFRLESCAPTERWLLLLAALRPGAVDPGWLGRISGLEPDTLSQAIVHLERIGLLVEEPGGRLRLPHGAVRDLVVDDATADALRLAHDRISEWLDDAGPGVSAAQRAWHLEQARTPGANEPLAQLHLDAGQELLRVYDLERARWHFQMAVARTVDRETARRAWEGRADCALLLTEIDDASSAYHRAIDLSDDPAYAVTVAAKAVYELYRRSARDDALALSRRALAMAGEPLPTGPVSALFSVLGALLTVFLPPPGRSRRYRDALLHLYTHLIAVVASSHGEIVGVSLFRSARLARGRLTEEAIVSRTFLSAALATLPVVPARVPRDVLDRAQKDAVTIGSVRALAVVEHIRGQNAFSVGDHFEGDRAMRAAVREFRKTGDMSVAVLTMSMWTVYQKNHAPTSDLVAWAEEVDLTARRQGNELSRAMALAVRTLAVVRRGGDPELLDRSIEAIDAMAPHVLDVVVACSVLSQALCDAGRAEEAWTQAERAREQLRMKGLGFLEILNEVYLAQAEVLARFPWVVPDSDRELDEALSALGRTGSPRLLAARDLCEAERALRRGEAALARTHLRRVIDDARHHGERWLVMRAHLLLADLSDDAAAARAHRGDAGALAEQLEVRLPRLTDPSTGSHPGDTSTVADPVGAEAVPVGVPDAPPPPAPDAACVDLVHLVRDLEPALVRALPTDVTLELALPDAAVHVAVPAATLEQLVANLVLVARDAVPAGGALRLSTGPVTLDQTGSALLPDGAAGDHVVVAVTTGGHVPTAILGGLPACREIAAELGGFLDLEEHPRGELTLSVYLHAQPAGESPGPQGAPGERVLVVHSNARVRVTLTQALERVGVRVMACEALPSAPEPGTWRAVFAEDVLAEPLRETAAGPRVVAVVSRRDTYDAGPHLRVPFGLGELERVLGELPEP